jgi:hypothetical protein
MVKCYVNLTSAQVRVQHRKFSPMDRMNLGRIRFDRADEESVQRVREALDESSKLILELGGNFYTDTLGGTRERPSIIRVREAYDTGASILAVACPICMIMIEDAVKTEGLAEKMVVRDISELVKGSLQKEHRT